MLGKTEKVTNMGSLVTKHDDTFIDIQQDVLKIYVVNVDVVEMFIPFKQRY